MKIYLATQDYVQKNRGGKSIYADLKNLKVISGLVKYDDSSAKIIGYQMYDKNISNFSTFLGPISFAEYIESGATTLGVTLELYGTLKPRYATLQIRNQSIDGAIAASIRCYPSEMGDNQQMTVVMPIGHLTEKEYYIEMCSYHPSSTANSDNDIGCSASWWWLY